MKSNYFRVVLIVSMIGGFQEKSFGASGASKPEQIVFEGVPQIHSMAYYMHKGGDCDGSKETIKGQMDRAFAAIARNIDRQKKAGRPFFSEADRKKFQLGQPEMHTKEYYMHWKGLTGVHYNAVDAEAIMQNERELKEYTDTLNARLTDLMLDGFEAS